MLAFRLVDGTRELFTDLNDNDIRRFCLIPPDHLLTSVMPTRDLASLLKTRSLLISLTGCLGVLYQTFLKSNKLINCSHVKLYLQSPLIEVTTGTSLKRMHSTRCRRCTWRKSGQCSSVVSLIYRLGELSVWMYILHKIEFLHYSFPYKR